jgi:hypothetical protein
MKGRYPMIFALLKSVHSLTVLPTRTAPVGWTGVTFTYGRAEGKNQLHATSAVKKGRVDL